VKGKEIDNESFSFYDDSFHDKYNYYRNLKENSQVNDFAPSSSYYDSSSARSYSVSKVLARAQELYDDITDLFETREEALASALEEAADKLRDDEVSDDFNWSRHVNKVSVAWDDANRLKNFMDKLELLNDEEVVLTLNELKLLDLH